MDEFADGEKR